MINENELKKIIEGIADKLDFNDKKDEGTQINVVEFQAAPTGHIMSDETIDAFHKFVEENAQEAV